MPHPPRPAGTTPIIALLLALSVVTPTLAATASDPEPAADKPYWRTNIFKRFAYDQKFLVMRWFPQEFRRPMFTGPLLGAVLLAANSKADGGGWDSVQQTEFQMDRNHSQTNVAHELTTLGNSPLVVAALGITYLASRRTGNDHMAETASLSAEALMSVGLYTVVLKAIASRTRPGFGSQGQFFQYGANRSGSFPSGHAMVSFSVATVFAEEFRQHRWVPWVAYGTAALIGAARIALGQHYPSDVIFGATLGHSLGEAVMAQQGEHGGRWYDRLAPYYDQTHHGWALGYEKRW